VFDDVASTFHQSLAAGEPMQSHLAVYGTVVDPSTSEVIDEVRR